MANIHVLERNGADYRLAYHIAVPNTNNSAGVNWRTAVVNSGKGGTTLLKDGNGTAGTISTAEKNSVVAGAILERIVTLDVTQGGTLAGQAIIDYINQHYASVSAEVLADLSVQLAEFGRTI